MSYERFGQMKIEIDMDDPDAVEWARSLSGLRGTRDKSRDDGPCVYVISSKTQRPVKIGSTKSVRKRLASLSTASSRKLEVFHVERTETIEGARALEKRIHAHFHHRRQRGEWFRMSVKTCVDGIAALRLNPEPLEEMTDEEWLEACEDCCDECDPLAALDYEPGGDKYVPAG